MFIREYKGYYVRVKKHLANVTLIGVDCVDIDRLIQAADICELGLSFEAVKLLSSIPSSDPRVFSIPAIRSVKEYSEFCITSMAAYVDTEFALIFQYDGFVLNPNAWSDEFLEYDYIGAPWYHLRGLRVGNGGFSLRSKRLLDSMAGHYKTIGGTVHPEDVWICKTARPTLEAVGMRFAPETVAACFSKEGDHRCVSWNGEFGFHGITYTDISSWLDLHPEYTKTLTYPLNDYTRLMKKNHPVWDGTCHTLRYHAIHMKEYAQLASHERNYDARMSDDVDEEEILPGHTVVCKRSGVSFKQVPIPAFERIVASVEHFPTKAALLAAHPDIEITYPIQDQPKWKRRLFSIFGNAACPREKPYLLLRFAH